MDNVNPTYYKDRPVEIIDCIESCVEGLPAMEGYLVGSIIKYLSRYRQKNGAEDLDKAAWYLNHLMLLVKEL